MIFYSGEVVWSERALKLEEIFSTLPAPDWVYLISKLIALFLVVAVFMATGAVATIAVQVFMGYFHLELPLYAGGLLIAMSFFMLLAVLGLFAQVVTGNKFAGYLLAVVAFLMGIAGFQKLGLEHNLYSFPGPPRIPYSDMNGFGHLLEPFLWFKLYWGFLGVVLVAVTRAVKAFNGSMIAAAASAAINVGVAKVASKSFKPGVRGPRPALRTAPPMVIVLTPAIIAAMVKLPVAYVPAINVAKCALISVTKSPAAL